ncbi:MAG: GGDEF domain-containing protein [Pseudanabaena sp.]|nr:MAG: GGDEF domain-containing protein [Pseudanabaena sp.]
MPSDPTVQQPVTPPQIKQITAQPHVIFFEAKTEVLTDYQIKLEQQITQHKLTEQNLKQTISALKTVNQELQHLAHIDALTQISNRRNFDESLHREWQRSLREKQPLSLVMLDIDFFKGYNDRYGHPAGDRCLTAIAQTIKGLLQRSTDLLARYGGEEFAIILPNTTTEGAITVIHSIQKAIAALSLVHESSSVGNNVTASFGLATMLPSEVLHPSLLLESTDKALYQAKQQGRDRYAVYVHS